MATVTLSDLSLMDIKLTPRVENLKRAYFKAMPEICVERPQLITCGHLEQNLFSKPRISILDKAKVYRRALEQRDPVVWHTCSRAKGMVKFDLEGEFADRSLFAGSTTSKFKGVPLYPEFLALALWPELGTISQRQANPFYLDNEKKDDGKNDAEVLNFEIFPHWMTKNIHELGRKKEQEGIKKEAAGRTKEETGMQLLERLVFFLVSKTECISHTLPDFSKAVNLGLRAVIDEAKKKGAAAPTEQKEFYAAIAEAMEGIIAYSRKLAARAEELAGKESDPEAKKELLDIARINRKIPEFPAESFREALTAVWICWIAIHLENPNVGLSLGRLDQLLYNHYRRDIDKGVLTVEDAVELICCLWLKIGDHVPMMPEAAEQLFGGTGSNQAITIGGVDKQGKDAVNDLTYVMIRATELMLLRDPNLNARYYPGVNSKDYLRRLCEANLITQATPALHNDKAVIRALTAKGDTEEQARDYGVIGCIEPGSNGRSYGATGAILLNLTSALELALFNGKHRHTGLGPQDPQIGPTTGDPADFRSFEEFNAAFQKQTRWLAEKTVCLNNILGAVHQEVYPTPILSALFEGPMDKGKDLIEGGAVINSSGVTIIGLADVADSLSAIQQVVFKEGSWTFPAFIEAMKKMKDDDGKDDEQDKKVTALQKRLTDPDKTPKYGNENPIADGNVTEIIRFLDKTFGGQKNYRGGAYRVGYWTMTNHAGFGKLMQATPNGRKACENFTSGITPVSGVTSSLSQTLNSVAKQPAECIGSGMAFNIRYMPEYDRRRKDDARRRQEDACWKQMLDNFVSYTETYFDQGGMEIQFNITKHEDFIAAANNPDDPKFAELLVRVSGYTAYFKDLSPQMRKEIIERSEYLLSTDERRKYEPFKLQQDA